FFSIIKIAVNNSLSAGIHCCQPLISISRKQHDFVVRFISQSFSQYSADLPGCTENHYFQYTNLQTTLYFKCYKFQSLINSDLPIISIPVLFSNPSFLILFKMYLQLSEY